MGWPWQEICNAVPFGKDSNELASRLVAAEKAILQRLQELSEDAGALAEIRALREALDSLYARRPQDCGPAVTLADEEETSERHFPHAIIAVGLGVTLAIATAWITVRVWDGNEGKGIPGRNETKTVINPHAKMIAKPPGPAVAAGSAKKDSQTISAQTAPSGWVTGDKLGRSNNAREQRQIEERPPEPIGIPPEERPVAEVAQASAARAPSQSTADDPGASSNGNASQSGVQEHDTTPSPHPSGVRGSVSFSSSAYPSIRVPSELKDEAARSGASLEIGALISREDPIYPKEAELQGIQGTVRLRAIVGRDGTVKDVQVVDGPSLLRDAGVSAIRRWQYEPTLLANQPVEVTEDITIVFRLANANAAAN